MSEDAQQPTRAAVSIVVTRSASLVLRVPKRGGTITSKAIGGGTITNKVNRS